MFRVGYSSQPPLQNVGVDITGVRLPILEQQCDQFFSPRLRKPVQYRVRRKTTDVMSDRRQQSIRDTATLDSRVNPLQVHSATSAFLGPFGLLETIGRRRRRTGRGSGSREKKTGGERRERRRNVLVSRKLYLLLFR